MDFAAEIFIEALGSLGELVFEEASEAVSGHRLSRWVRILLLAGLALCCAALFTIILAAGIGAFRELPPVSLLLFALDAALAFMTVRKLRKILRAFSHK